MQTSTQTISLGASGLAIAPLGVGTWAWGDSLFWSYGKDYSEAELQEAFDVSVQAGVSLFDTAEIYGLGESERLVGRFAKAANQPICLATKYFPLPWRIWGSAVADALTASLQRLQVPIVDLYQVHWPFDFLMGQPTLMQALAEEVKQGRIRAVGVSNYSAEQMKRSQDLLSKAGVPLAVNQVQYSLLARQIEQNGVMQAAKDSGVTILAYSPLAQGLLTGKYTVATETTPTGARRIDPRFKQQGLEKISPLLELLQELASKYDRTPAQVSLNWLIAQGNVVPIPGAKNAKQAEQNAGALGWQLSAEECDRLSEVSLQVTAK